jgi:hypothetical protein
MSPARISVWNVAKVWIVGIRMYSHELEPLICDRLVVPKFSNKRVNQLTKVESHFRKKILKVKST